MSLLFSWRVRIRIWENSKSVSLTSVLEMMVETVSDHVKSDRWLNSQHGFKKVRLCQANLLALYSETTSLVDESSGCGLSWLYHGFWHCLITSSLTNLWSMAGINGQWDSLKTGWTSLKGLWSVAQSVAGGQSLVVYTSGPYWGQYCLISSLMIWMMRQSVPKVNLQMVQTWEEWLMHQRVGSSAIQRDLNRWEKWADSNIKFSKGKCKSLHLGRNNSIDHYTVEANWLESSFAEKDPGVLVDTKLNMSW